MGSHLYCLSKLQTEITLSTSEAEHIALSHSMSEVLHLLTLLEKIYSSIGVGPISKYNIAKCTVFKTKMVAWNWQHALVCGLETSMSQ